MMSRSYRRLDRGMHREESLPYFQTYCPGQTFVCLWGLEQTLEINSKIHILEDFLGISGSKSAARVAAETGA